MTVNGMAQQLSNEQDAGFVVQLCGEKEMYMRDGLHLSGKWSAVFAITHHLQARSKQCMIGPANVGIGQIRRHTLCSVFANYTFWHTKYELSLTIDMGLLHIIYQYCCQNNIKFR